LGVFARRPESPHDLVYAEFELGDGERLLQERQEPRILPHGLIVFRTEPLAIHGHFCAIDAAMGRRRNESRRAVDQRRTIWGGLIRTVVAELPEDLFWSWLMMRLLQPLMVISSGPPAPGQSSYFAATLAAGSVSHTAASRPGSRKAVLKKFENVSELGSKRQ
jgi:hypothetical protein